jgi:hypothetical protein
MFLIKLQIFLKYFLFLQIKKKNVILIIEDQQAKLSLNKLNLKTNHKNLQILYSFIFSLLKIIILILNSILMYICLL